MNEIEMTRLGDHCQLVFRKASHLIFANDGVDMTQYDVHGNLYLSQ